jgi:hypothetical protein
MVVLVVRYGMVRPKQQRRNIRLFPWFSLPLVGDVIPPGVRGPQVRSYNHGQHGFNSNTLRTTILSSGRG